MSSSQMSNNIFDTFLNSFTNGLVPDIQTALSFGIVCIIGYISVDIIWGQAISTWWEKIEDEGKYKQYQKNRDRSAEFKRRYAAYDEERQDRVALDRLSKTIRVRGSNDCRQSAFNSDNF